MVVVSFEWANRLLPRLLPCRYTQKRFEGASNAGGISRRFRREAYGHMNIDFHDFKGETFSFHDDPVLVL